MGGSTESKEQAEYIQKEWRSYGLDTVELKKYDVILSYPKKPGLARIVDGRVEHFRASQKQKTLDGKKNDGVLSPFNAFSGSGNLTVSYGLLMSWDTLQNRDLIIWNEWVIDFYSLTDSKFNIDRRDNDIIWD